MMDAFAGVATAQRPACSELVGGRATADELAALRLAWAMTGFPCVLRAIRELERLEPETAPALAASRVPAD
jgi:hypothetical protein